jgi:TatD DNase family protein
MQLIDTHTHIYLPEFDNDRDETIKRAIDDGISKLFMPNIDVDSIDQMMSVAEKYPGICYPMIGLHPTSVKENYKDQLDQMERLLAEKKFIAIGEIGIDLYWDKTFRNEQLIAFRRQIETALSHDLPVVVHSRDAFPEVFSVLEEFRGRNLKGVLHAFTGNTDEARHALDLGFMLGIGGIVTFKNSGLDKTVADIGPDNLILETDSPYLAPVPYRGKRNESSYICIVNRKLAEIFNMTEENMAEITFSNSVRLFKLD